VIVARVLASQDASVAQLARGRVDAAVLDASEMSLVKALRSAEAVKGAQGQSHAWLC
jgi:ABC-type phosphate/phosphonate transport system substrate-binding protein